MCGIAAYYGPSAVPKIYRMLIELQHRGQESAGISFINKQGRVKTIKGRGLVVEAVPFENLGDTGSAHAIGHVRYSTSGGFMDYGSQPVEIGVKPRISIAFNGNIINYRELGAKIGVKSDNANDTIVLAHLLYKLTLDNNGDVVEAVKQLADYVIGSYSVVVLTSEPRIVIARDPHGFKPLAYSYTGKVFAAASETPALEQARLYEWTELGPGEIVSFDGKGVETTTARRKTVPTPCVFEYVYFSRPDSFFNGIQVHTARVRMGELLGITAPVEADLVIPVPDSGRSAALGYSRSTGLPFDEGLMRNRYVGRSFIMPPGLRELVSDVKYGVIRDSVQGRRIVLVDDSLIRGTTMRSIIRVLRMHGAREVHVRIASPPVRYPCFMGIDFPTRRELIASRTRSINEIAEEIGADTLEYNSLENLKKAVGIPSLCMACFSGVYPFSNMDISQLEKIFARTVR